MVSPSNCPYELRRPQFCSKFPAEWADDDNDENSDAESVHDYENSNNSSTNLQNIDRLPVDILEAIKSLGLIEKVSERHTKASQCVNYF